IAAHEKALQKSCSTFNTKCVDKDCMSTASLPFYVRDLGMWHFREACKTQHLDKSSSFVGRALLARGTSYCQEVTELCEEEYPLVHNARMSGLTSCFAVFLHSIAGDNEYVLEFFQPLDSKDGIHVSDLVQTLKQKVEVVSGFKLGVTSAIEFIGPNIQRSLTTTANSLAFGPDSSDIESLLAIDTEKRTSITDVGVKCHHFKRGRKCKIASGSIQRAKVEATFKRDEANDWILITCDVDLALAFETSERKSISIRCEVD
ncbi:hypothetical protein Tco_1187487, partial [Tanacetum coccineum]